MGDYWTERRKNAKVINELWDVYGNPIVVGSKVAYNYSGEMRLGIVIELKKNKSNYGWLSGGKYGLFPFIMVKEMQGGIVSKVRRSESVVVVSESIHINVEG